MVSNLMLLFVSVSFPSDAAASIAVKWLMVNAVDSPCWAGRAEPIEVRLG